MAYDIEIVDHGLRGDEVFRVTFLIRAKSLKSALLYMDYYERFAQVGPGAWADRTIAAERQSILAEMTGYQRWVLRIRDTSANSVIALREYAWNCPSPREYIPQGNVGHLFAIALINKRKSIVDRELYREFLKGNKSQKAPLP